MSMGSELSETQFSPTPKLSLFSLPHHTPETPSESTLTPPFQTPASVPFKWEEAPGRPCLSIDAKPKVARCLELPPGKITNMPLPSLDGPEPGPSPKLSSFLNAVRGDGKITNTPSPSSVLDGPGSGPNVSKTTSFSFRKFLKGDDSSVTNTPSPSMAGHGPGLGPNVSKTNSFSFRKFLKGEGKISKTPSPSSVLVGAGQDISQTMSFSSQILEECLVLKLVDKEKVNFSSWRWGSERGFEEEGEGNFDFSSPFGGLQKNGSRLRKRTGFWANIYKNVKQAVPWKRKQDKRRRMNM